MFEVILTKEARKNLKKIHSHYKSKISKCFKSLRENPFYGRDIKKLSGELEGLYRYRINAVRIVYHIHKGNKLVSIIAIRSRSAIYK